MKNRFEDRNRQGVEGTEGMASGKPYAPPRLTEWGTLVDLTHGPTTGFEDFPAQGGTQGV